MADLKIRLPWDRRRHDCLRHGRAVISLVQDLFGDDEDVEVARADNAPLATRIRPRSLDELVGQEHILGPGKLLRRAIEADRLPSVIFSGPPGTGKTTLARIIAEVTHAKFIRISGVESNVAEMRRDRKSTRLNSSLSQISYAVFCLK